MSRVRRDLLIYALIPARAPARGPHERIKYLARVVPPRRNEDPAATLDDLREVVTTYEETERTARRVLGGAHPLAPTIELYLLETRAVLRARESSS